MNTPRFDCFDCGVDTADLGEYYMVAHSVWEEATAHCPESRRRMLCIGCLETRLKRALAPSDFPDLPVNSGLLWRFSARLLDRMGLNRQEKHING